MLLLLGISPKLIFLAAEVRRCPLRSEAFWWRSGAAHSARELPGGGPALPTPLASSPLRSGAAHCNLELPVEVRRCPLQRKAGEDDGEEKKEEEEDEEEEGEEKEEDRTALIKSNDP